MSFFHKQQKTPQDYKHTGFVTLEDMKNGIGIAEHFPKSPEYWKEKFEHEDEYIRNLK